MEKINKETYVEIAKKIIKAYEKYDSEQEKKRKNDTTVDRERTGERRYQRRG